VLESGSDVAESLADLAQVVAVVSRLSVRRAGRDLVDEAGDRAQLARDPLKGLRVRCTVGHLATVTQPSDLVSTARIICLTQNPLPAGTVTFLLTDIEGSTIRWEADPSGMRAAMARHDSIIGEQLEAHRGVQVEAGREGDSIMAAFGRAADAASAAIGILAAFAAGTISVRRFIGVRACWRPATAARYS
jgi:hypothetical protein